MAVTKTWYGANTAPPEELIAHYKSGRVWDHTAYIYETWRKTTALIDPPAPFDELEPRMQIAMCALAFQVEQWTKDDLQNDSP